MGNILVEGDLWICEIYQSIELSIVLHEQWILHSCRDPRLHNDLAIDGFCI